jgi:hypothetical protein
VNERKYIMEAFFCLKKAFDVCSHNVLLKKLKKIEIVMAWNLNGFLAT